MSFGAERDRAGRLAGALDGSSLVAINDLSDRFIAGLHLPLYIVTACNLL
jgi:hypothetical protein